MEKTENKEKTPRTKGRITRRISLSDKASRTIENWRRLLQEKYPGIRVSDTDLVNWCLEKQNPDLSKKDMGDLADLFFDAVKQLEWMLSQAKLAKANKTPFVLEKRPILAGKMPESAASALSDSPSSNG